MMTICDRPTWDYRIFICIISMFIQLVVKLINACVKWHYNFNENIQLILQIHHYEIDFNFDFPFHYLKCQQLLQISFEWKQKIVIQQLNKVNSGFQITELNGIYGKLPIFNRFFFRKFENLPKTRIDKNENVIVIEAFCKEKMPWIQELCENNSAISIWSNSFYVWIPKKWNTISNDAIFYKHTKRRHRETFAMHLDMYASYIQHAISLF